MPDDILVPLDPAQVPTHRKPRWHQLVIVNGEGLTDKRIHAQGQTVPVRLVDGLAVRVQGDPERSPGLDLTIEFDAENPDHVEVMTVLDRIVKAAYAARQNVPSLEHG